MNYRQKRNSRKLSVYCVSKALGIPYNDYVAIERKDKVMPDDKVALFNEIIQNSGSYRLNYLEEVKKAKESIEDGSLKKKMFMVGSNGAAIGRELGYSQGYMSMALQGKTFNDTLLRVYDAIEDKYKSIVVPKIVKSSENIEKATEETIETLEEEQTSNDFTKLAEVTNKSLETYKMLVDHLQSEVDFYKKIINKLVG